MLSRRRLLAAVAAAAGLGLAGCASGGGPKPPPLPQPKVPPHLTAAEQLVEGLGRVPWESGRNAYKTVPQDDGRLTQVSWGAGSRVLAQCASFQTLVLEHAYGPGTPYEWATDLYFRDHFFSNEGLHDSSKRYPNAAEYRAGFAAGSARPCFAEVLRPEDLRPGDLVAIDYRDPRAWYTGHIAMIRAAKGTLVAPVDGQVGGGAVGHVFQVLDCTDAPHGDPEYGNLALYESYPDTRWSYARHGDHAEDLTHHTGAGYGHMILYADPTTGRFAGYRWSVNDAQAFRASDRPIAAARVAYAQRPATAEASPSWDRSLS